MADLNANLILQGQSPNMLAQYSQGRALGRQAAMEDMLRQNAGGLMQGDPQALNALAAYDPAVAQRMQLARSQEARAVQSHDLATKEASMRMQGLSAEQKRKAQEYAAGLSAAEKQAQLAKVEQGLKGGAFFYEKGDKAGYENFLRQSGIDPAQYPFEQFPAIANQYRDFAEILKTTEPKTQIVDGQLVTIGQDGASAQPIQGLKEAGPEWRDATPEEMQRGIMQVNTKSGAYKMMPQNMKVRSDGQGGFTLSQGVGVGDESGPPDLTVEAGKNTGYYLRSQTANEVLNELESQGTEFWQQQTENVPFGIGNYLRSPEFQKFDQARRNFINAVLRRESGAVISDAEFENGNKQYFPMPGDSPQVIAQKRQNRLDAIEGMRIGSGAGAAYVDQNAAGSEDDPLGLR